MAVAGGTGISFALPIIMTIVEQSKMGNNKTSTEKNITTNKKVVELAWVIRRGRNVEWVRSQLENLLSLETEEIDLRIRIFITRDTDSSTDSIPERVEEVKGEKEISVTDTSGLSSSSSLSSPSSCPAASLAKERENIEIEWLANKHPQMNRIVDEFLQRTSDGGRTQVVGSGPEGMGRDFRAAVAIRNDGAAVWRGDEKHDIGFSWDNRFF